MIIPIAGPSRGEVTAPIILDSAGVDVLYCSIIQHQSFSTGDLMVIDEAVSALHTASTVDQLRLQLETTSEPISSLAMSLALVIASLAVITSLCSPALVVVTEPMITNSTSLIANTLVCMRTLFGCSYLFCSADGCPCDTFNN